MFWKEVRIWGTNKERKKRCGYGKSVFILFGIKVGAGEHEHLAGGLDLEQSHAQIAHTLDAAPIITGIAVSIIILNKYTHPKMQKNHSELP